MVRQLPRIPTKLLSTGLNPKSPNRHPPNQPTTFTFSTPTTSFFQASRMSHLIPFNLEIFVTCLSSRLRSMEMVRRISRQAGPLMVKKRGKLIGRQLCSTPTNTKHEATVQMLTVTGE
ncbi:hypothetical protein Droror1_Dr00024288 [Drosera rotundifolia]